MPGFGRTGPASDRIAYGPMIDGHAGLSVVQGYPDDVARKGGIAWPDPVAGLHAAAFADAGGPPRPPGRQRSGRHDRGRPARGHDLVTRHAVIDRQLDGCEPVPIGSRDRCLAPQGVHPCRGEDGWIAVSVVDDSSWVALCEVAGLASDWCGWDVGSRRLHHDAIDAALGRWTSGVRRRTGRHGCARPASSPSRSPTPRWSWPTPTSRHVAQPSSRWTTPRRAPTRGPVSPSAWTEHRRPTAGPLHAWASTAVRCS